MDRPSPHNSIRTPRYKGAQYIYNGATSSTHVLRSAFVCCQRRYKLNEALTMGSANHSVHSSGIFHNLPTFDDSLTGLTAIITGASGISGFGTLRVLLESPQRWSKIFTLSRKPIPNSMLDLLSSDERSRIEHVSVDLLASPSDIASQLKSSRVSANYVFFYSYLQPKAPKGARAWSNADELVKVNAALFSNFLDALPEAAIKPQRILLQTGAKNYGAHLGRHRSPACESDPQPKHLQPNFYYPQEELLFKYCKQHRETSWNLIHPGWIVGAVTTAQINAFHPFAVYAAVCAHRGEPMQFPGDWSAWQFEVHPATAILTSYLSEWAILEDKCKNERFNAQDTSPMSWDRFWHECARWFGVTAGVRGPEEDDGKYSTMQIPGGADSPMGYGPPSTHRASFSFQDWARKPENQKAWKEIMDKSGGTLTDNPFVDIEANFEMADAVLLPIATMNMSKARRMGWTGYVDSIEAIFLMYKENARLGLIPSPVVDAARPLI